MKKINNPTNNLFIVTMIVKICYKKTPHKGGVNCNTEKLFKLEGYQLLLLCYYQEHNKMHLYTLLF